MRKGLIAGLAVVAVAAFAGWWLLESQAPTLDVPHPAVSSSASGTVLTQPLAAPKGTGAISGQVLREGTPVAGAIVSATGVEPGETLSTIDCDCDCGASLLATDCDRQSEQVEALIAQRRGEVVPLARTQTDREGRFTLEGLAPGALSVWADAPDGGTALHPDATVGARDLALELGDSAPLKGEVLIDDEAAPAVHARVTAVNAEHSRYFDTQTDSNGAFAFAALPKGPYVIVAAAPGLHSGINWAPSGVHVQLVLYRPRTVLGHVRFRHAPAVGVTVTLENGGSHAEAVTRGDGSFRFVGVENGHVAVFASSGLNVARQEVNLTVAETNVELELAPGTRLSGRVRSARGETIAGADLTLRAVGYSLSARSTDGGQYALEPIGDPSGTLIVGADGFVELNEPLALAPGEQRHDVTLQPEAVFAGVVVDAQGLPVSKAILEVERRQEASDADGGFTMHGLAPGHYGLRITHPAFETANLVVDAPNPRARLELSRGLSISGRAESPSGQPVPNAAVRVVGTGHEAKTDADGRFVVSGLSVGQTAAGKVVLFGETRGTLLWRGRLALALGHSNLTDVRLVLHELKDISGFVEMSTPGPLEAGLYVAALPFNDTKDPSDGRRAIATHPADSGFFRIGPLEDGDYEVVAGVGSESSVRTRTHSGDNQVRLVVPRGTAVRGRVVDGTGAPLKSFLVNGRRFEGDTGEFEMSMAEGAQELTFTAEHFVPVTKTVEVVAHAPVSLGDVAMGGGQDVTVQVVRADTRAPISGARVLALSSWESMFRDDESLGTTAGDGRTTVHGVTGGDTLVVAATGFGAQRVTFAAGELEKTVALSAGGHLKVSVLDAAGKPLEAAVDLTSVDHPADAPRGLSDGVTGVAEFADVAAGQWVATAHLPDARVVSAGTQLASGGEQSVELRAPSRTAVVIVDTTQLPQGTWTMLWLSPPLGAPKTLEELRVLDGLASVNMYLSPPDRALVEGVAVGTYLVVLGRDDSDVSRSVATLAVTVTGAPGQVFSLLPPDTFTTLR